MLFFKRILKQPGPAPANSPAVERRSEARFSISPDFPLKSVLSFVARDETGNPMSNSRAGWNWKGRLVDLSEEGARLQLGPAVPIRAAESCELILSVQDFQISVNCEVTNVTESPEGILIGLKLLFDHPETQAAYRQLIEVIALGSTLVLQSKTPQPDASGYIVETYGGPRAARLTVWRYPANGGVGAFELVFQDNMIRAAAGQQVEFLTDLDGRGSQPASTEKCMEIGRLFQWVVPNLPASLPPEVRAFLRHYAG